MQVMLFILVVWFGLGALAVLALLGTSVVFRRSELPLAMQIADTQHRQLPVGALPQIVRPAVTGQTELQAR